MIGIVFSLGKKEQQQQQSIWSKYERIETSPTQHYTQENSRKKRTRGGRNSFAFADALRIVDFGVFRSRLLEKVLLLFWNQMQMFFPIFNRSPTPPTSYVITSHDKPMCCTWCKCCYKWYGATFWFLKIFFRNCNSFVILQWYCLKRM